jgi:aryl sulfotransferase
MLIDSGLLTHGEIERLRPRLHETLAADEDVDGLRPAHGVRFPKVHDAYTLTPEGEPLLAGRRGADGAVVMVRDPRDVACSLAHHHRSSIDDAIAFMNDADAGYSLVNKQQHAQFHQKLMRWSDHVASWLDQRDIPVHVVRYEDLQADTAATFAPAMGFAGRAVSAAEIKRAVAYSGFTQLQKQERDKGFRETPYPGATFFRRGAVGGWRDEFTPEQAARIEMDHGAMMQRLGYQTAAAMTALAQAG